MRIRATEIIEQEFDLDAPDGLGGEELERWVKDAMEDFPGPSSFVGVVSRSWEIVR
ncbi:hypothetical protein [Chromobacterium vaccinii]|uniref:hypothetical protein n=1 Tax=Chromobacterium vaccinii TaxID=1108595 RepID=UPI00345B1062